MIMLSYMDSTNKIITGAFFFSFIILSSFVMLNMFVLIVIQEFQTYYIDSSNPLIEFSNYIQIFRECWNKYTIKTKGAKIKHSNLTSFFTHLETPLGNSSFDFESNKHSLFHALLTFTPSISIFSELPFVSLMPCTSVSLFPFSISLCFCVQATNKKSPFTKKTVKRRSRGPSRPSQAAPSPEKSG